MLESFVWLDRGLVCLSLFSLSCMLFFFETFILVERSLFDFFVPVGLYWPIYVRFWSWVLQNVSDLFCFRHGSCLSSLVHGSMGSRAINYWSRLGLALFS